MFYIQQNAKITFSSGRSICRSQDESVFVGLVCVYQHGRRAKLREHVLACMSILIGSYFRNIDICFILFTQEIS